MNQEKIGKFILECRKKKNMTQSELAEKLGVTDRSISNWENGKCMPDLSLFKPLCQQLAITVNELLSGEIINEERYQGKSEENIINIMTLNDNKNKKRKKLFLIICIFMILLFIFYAVSNYMYHVYEYDMDYDDRIMNCNIDEGILRINLDGYDLAHATYMEIEYENNSIIFYTVKNTKYSIKHSQFRIEENMRELLNSGKVVYRQYSVINLDKLKKPESVKVYYTKESFKNITSSNIDVILSKSNLMCQTN